MIEPFLPPFVARSRMIAAPGRALRRALLAALAIALVAGPGPALAQGRGGIEDFVPERRAPGSDLLELEIPVADPAAVVATELAFSRAAQEDGQWTAYAAYADEDAIMFAPQPVKALTWLSGRADPEQAVRWQTHQVWVSCDGSLAVTRGGWERPNGSVGYFTTVWAQQESQGDGYRWVLDQGDTLAEPLAAPDAVEESVADCPWTGSRGMSEDELESLDSEALGAGANLAGSGWSADGTLAYRYAVQDSGAREFVVFFVKGGRVREIIHSEVAAP